MKLKEIVQQLQLDVVHVADINRDIREGYASDLLSCVMAGAQADNVWVTLQAHPNVIAVASLLDLGAVIITEGAEPNEQTVHQAHDKAINVLRTTKDTFRIVMELCSLGITANSG
jgi:hypothetical protein